MGTVVIEDEVRIPGSFADLDAFCEWACSDEFPERGRFTYLRGDVWVDLSPEDIYTHNLLKGVFGASLHVLVEEHDLGVFFPDGCLLANREADLSNEADGTFASWQTLKTKRIRAIRGRRGYERLEGTPDMVLEIVSYSSVHKDTVELREAYWAAGIAEYWLVDVRNAKLRFDILRHGKHGYVAVRKQAGWLKSAVFGKSFRLSVGRDELDEPEYILSVR